MTLNELVAFVRLTLTRPRAGFQAVLNLAPSAEARWLALAIVVLLSVGLTQFVLLGVPDEVLMPFMTAMRHPVQGTVIQALTVLSLAFGTSGVARLFGGTARFQDALWIVCWVEFLLLLAEMVTLFATILLPVAGDLLGILSIALFFWLLTQATMFLNGFRSAVPVFIGILGGLLLTGIVAIGLLSALGVAPMPPPTGTPATIGMN